MVKYFQDLKLSLVILLNLLFPFSQVDTGKAQKPNFVTSIQNDVKCELSCASEITSVSELSDIHPTDWIYTALLSLLDRYDLPANKKFDGNRSLTRYEFAAVVSAAIESTNKQIPLNSQNLTQEDLKLLQRLQTEFATEIETLQKRVELLEQRLPG